MKATHDVRTVRVAALARVEGEGALHLVMHGDEVDEVRLDIYEPPRFFEGFLRGRPFHEVPDITARICGICPIAYQMSSAQALEKALGVHEEMDPAIGALRDFFYCGEWIESHVLHVFMLHLPDFLGYESALTMAADHPEIVQRALRIKKLGNALVAAVGGRAVHPVSACVGGFHAPLDTSQAATLLPEVEACRDDMAELTMFLAEKLEYPDLDRDYEFVALCPEDQYPMNHGPIRSNKGLRVDQADFLRVIEEQHVAHSTALHSVIRGRGAYLVGPLARLNLNAPKLHPAAAELLPKVCDAVRKQLPWKNNFLSLPARALETVHALATAADFLRAYRAPARWRVAVRPRAGVGAHGTEAPRGLCWHQYRTNDDGRIVDAHIIPPTAQNQKSIEEDLRALAHRLADVPDEEAALQCERCIRNYDPCISCSVHFLQFDRIRR